MKKLTAVAADRMAAEVNRRALAEFRARARRRRPTRQHRPGLWENMLGTVYAMNRDGEVRYFDYDYADAVRFVGDVDDVRTARYDRYVGRMAGKWSAFDRPRVGQLVWYVKDRER